MSVEEAQELARAVPRLDVVIVAGPNPDAPLDETIRVGATAIVTTGRKGKYLGSWRFGRDDGELGEFRPEAVVDDFEKSPAIEGILLEYYRDRLVEQPPPIDSYFERHPTKSGAAYQGADEATCGSCHPKAWEIWSKTAMRARGRRWSIRTCRRRRTRRRAARRTRSGIPTA
jgi:hypothetical protein